MKSNSKEEEYSQLSPINQKLKFLSPNKKYTIINQKETQNQMFETLLSSAVNNTSHQNNDCGLINAPEIERIQHSMKIRLSNILNKEVKNYDKNYFSKNNKHYYRSKKKTEYGLQGQGQSILVDNDEYNVTGETRKNFRGKDPQASRSINSPVGLIQPLLEVIQEDHSENNQVFTQREEFEDKTIDED